MISKLLTILLYYMLVNSVIEAYLSRKELLRNMEEALDDPELSVFIRDNTTGEVNE